MLARTYFPLLAVLISCTARTGQPEVESASSPLPPPRVASGAGPAAPSTADTASAALPPHVSLEGDDPSLTAEQRATALAAVAVMPPKVRLYKNIPTLSVLESALARAKPSDG